MEGNNHNNNNNGDAAAAASSSSSSSTRWTCEACGCNTNTETDRNCTICGTSNGASLLRRVNYVRPGLFARSVAARRSFFSEELGMEGYELWERGGGAGGNHADDDDDLDIPMAEEEQAFAALGLDFAGIPGRREIQRQRRGGIDSAARSFGAASRRQDPAASALEPNQLWQLARENASLYQPKWMNPSQIGGRIRTGNGIEVGSGQNQGVAHLPLGAGEGRAIRALEAFSRGAHFASLHLAAAASTTTTSSAASNTASTSPNESRSRRAFGFRVAFHGPMHASTEQSSLGGNYLIGVTTTAFAGFADKNALQHSSVFWGIDDSGRKFEGSGNYASRDSRLGLGGSGVPMVPESTPRNAAGRLFGSMEVITCVADFATRSLAFWRDETFLGILCTNLPRGGNLYPICVPYKAGSTVAITGMNEDPLPLIRSFAADWKHAQEAKDADQRQKVLDQRAVFVQYGALSASVQHILQTIFSWYAHKRKDRSRLRKVEASRLWYRCGMKLSHLDELIQSKDANNQFVSVEDFLGLFNDIIQRDEEWFSSIMTRSRETCNVFQIGDRVQLVEGYERYGDATNGPLQGDDRGVVVDIQEGPAGERNSVRVFHNYRRWWYQPQAIVREKSGLVLSPGVWLLQRILRVHGFDPISLTFLPGKGVATSPWRLGDIVVPKKLAREAIYQDTSILDKDVGRVVSDHLDCSVSLGARSRDNSSVLIDFVSKDFADACGLQTDVDADTLETRRVPVSRLVYSNPFLGKFCKDVNLFFPPYLESEENSPACAMEIDHVESTISEKTRGYLKNIKELDVSAIENITNECKKNATTLAALFEHGLADEVASACDALLARVGKEKTSLAQAIIALGGLALVIGQKAFPETKAPESTPTTDVSLECKPAPSLAEAAEDYRTQRNIEQHTNRSTRTSQARSMEAFQAGMRASQLSSQQRRNMLLTLMSRARNGGTANFNDLLGVEAANFRHAAGEDMPHGLDSVRDSASMWFSGSDSEEADGVTNRRDETATEESSRPTLALEEREEKRKQDPEVQAESSLNFLLSKVVRELGDQTSDSTVRRRSNHRPRRVVVSMTNALLGNSLFWLKATLPAHEGGSSSRSHSHRESVLRSLFDEEGTPILRLAVSLGCSPEILRFLIQYGCTAGDSEIEIAAYNDQTDALAELLQYSVYKEGTIDLERCSPNVAEVLSGALQRQQSQVGRIRESATLLLSSLLAKLYEMGLRCRRMEHTDDICGSSVAQALVGNVVLRALGRQQSRDSDASKDFTPTQNTDRDERENLEGRGGREIVDASVDSCSKGLLDFLPNDIIGTCLSADPNCLSNYFLLVEEYLCSKSVNDISVGLTLLLSLLKRFPALRTCSEVERYGFLELISSHDAYASNMLSRSGDVGGASAGNADSSSTARCGVVQCPKRHVASLHITRHSSFRCDLCGKGVERGRTMYGCRECDWDACEICTDKGEGGMVKWAYVRETAQECQAILSEDAIDAKEDKWGHTLAESVMFLDNSTEVNNLSLRILQRDRDSIKDLGEMLAAPGCLTMHQFLGVILPALHFAMLGKATARSGAGLTSSQFFRRSKRPRMIYPSGDGIPVGGCPESRYAFAKDAARFFILGHGMQVKCGSNDDTNNRETGSSAGGATDDDTKNQQPLQSELLRRLHKILALYENVPFSPDLRQIGNSTFKDDLQSLTKPIAMNLVPVNPTHSRYKSAQYHPLRVYADPLLSLKDLSRQVLQSCAVAHPVYTSFCRSLVSDSAIILERPLQMGARRKVSWSLARVMAFNSTAGYHVVRRACGFAGRHGKVVDMRSSLDSRVDQIVFEEKESFIHLVSREVFVVYRKSGIPCAFDMNNLLSEDFVDPDADIEADDSQLEPPIVGSRVDSNISSSEWRPLTIVDVAENNSNDGSGGTRYTLVSDEGDVFTDVTAFQVRGLPFSTGDSTEGASGRHRGDRTAGLRNQPSRTFHFLALRRQGGDRRDSMAPQHGLLKRSWSALSLRESMCPIDLKVGEKVSSSYLECSMGDQTIQLMLNSSQLEQPPSLHVKFGVSKMSTSFDASSSPDTTVVALLLFAHPQEEGPPGEIPRIFYTIFCDTTKSARNIKGSLKAAPRPMESEELHTPGEPFTGTHFLRDLDIEISGNEVQSRKRSPWSPNVYDHDPIYTSNEVENSSGALCPGLNEICVHCMELVGILADLSEADQTEQTGTALPAFESQGLSKKLTEQLECPLVVVGGALPEWCFVGPTFSPRVFSYDVRRLLLQRAAFGVSRSTLNQQESKVNVGRLRQRMASLRARAVELVGEAFSGGAEDPTALQLQADELYGMEEALATRVRAAFRAEKWEEHALEVVKAAINRDLLLSDAISVMEQYASVSHINRRRLEVRFNGESGFDAASGDEAGVTRGFYADVAEALISCDIVAGVGLSTFCPDSLVPSTSLAGLEVKGKGLLCQLPLWIPDVDASGQVIIPTPRSDPNSALGVFPRPLSPLNPVFGDVLDIFRFMGRLFAAAMRDGFMFPLPLSASFLKLVQLGKDEYQKGTRSSGWHAKNFSISSGDTSSSRGLEFDGDTILGSVDLPRAGFLCGEIAAVETHIVTALERVDQAEPRLSASEMDERYNEIARDKGFARTALGKNYDCSFEDYFEDRTFVDPLDPTQGVDAIPLCPNGHERRVTIHNVREWVVLAKKFVLHDGVIAQAMAFRQGVEDFFSPEFLRLFTPAELQKDVCGVGDNVDNWDEAAIRALFKLDGGKGAAEALVAVAAIGGEGGAALSRRFGPTSPTIKFVIQALLEATPRMRRQFLSFVTSVPIVTPGQIEVVPIVSPSGDFMPMHDPNCLPRANTCSRRLYLPKFDSYKTFSQVLWAVVREESKFKGFYEWRGSN